MTSACGDARTIERTSSLDGCSRCHGSAENAAPPTSTLGATETSERAVGAHQRHLRAGLLAAPLVCEDCHVVPKDVYSPGHIDGPHGTVTFGAMARAGGAAPVWDRNALTCTGTYCHGGTLAAGGSNVAPVWTAVDEGQTACGTCHGNPPPAPHPSNPACSRCHPDTVSAAGTIDLVGGRHLDGKVDVGPLGCTSCHGSEANAAPPIASTGAEATTAVAVGAHQAHVTTGAVRQALACDACHVVPTTMLHADGTPDLAWSALAGSVTWNRTAATCATYCHGATLAGGTNTVPTWTEVGTEQTACGTCHGNPPPAPHPSNPACGRCHPDTVTAAGTIDVGGARHIDGTLDIGPLGCSVCHGSDANPAPPISTTGESATTALAVGAHQAHVTTGAVRQALACDACHVVPATMLHANGTVDLDWSALAGSVTWNRTAATCATYCHGATLAAGGTNTLPTWTAVGSGQTACGTCHGNPPPAPHPSVATCSGCHAGTVEPGGAIAIAGGQHIDGIVQLAGIACSSCHGSEANPAPPVSTTGETATTALAVGAHQAHVTTGVLRQALACSDCHVVPSVLLHADGTVDLSWSPLAGSVTWDRTAATCATYCHGATLAAGGTNTLPTWTAVGAGQTACGTCHGNPPPAPHPSNPSCSRCHPDTVTAAGAIDVAAARHIDGTVDVGPLACSGCHGSDANAAPPISTTGESATTALAVGAHQSHVTTGTVRQALACSECHVVPTTMLHADGSVDLAWSPLAGSVTWDRTAATCATYCHGATLAAGGTNTVPTWTAVGTGQTACGTCHGNPPPAPHPSATTCDGCHAGTIGPGGAIDVAGGQHIDGIVQLAGAGCSACHGSDANPAPPISTTGESATTAVAVGAHQAHVTTGTVRQALACSDCHVVPSALIHADGTVDLAWSPLAGSVTWNRSEATCATYCHGATLAAGGTNTLPIWTDVGAGQTACGTCHGNPPPAPHPSATTCDGCHAGTVLPGGAIDVAGGQHIDGIVQLSGGGCSACHGSETNPAPPISTTGESATTALAVGAHQAHVTTGAVRQALACSACHVVPSALIHADGTVDLAWSALAGSVTWNRTAATCATYCHGATLAGGTITVPIWTQVGVGQTACGTCHGNPPPAPHPSNPSCSRCHPDTVTAAGTIDVAGARHIDGTVDVGPLGCSGCHGSDANAAPPVSTTGESATTAVAVGAHQAHVTTGMVRQALACGACHVTPSTMLHANGTVDLAWSALAGSVTWDRTAATCATYCHGATLAAGGTNTLPTWTAVGSGQTACGTCHGNPPPAPHPSATTCDGCHAGTVGPGGAIDVAGGQHIDGTVQLAGAECSACHGSDANAAPPISTTGETATTALAVGAHQAHVTTGAIRQALACGECHVLPTTLLHANGTVDLAWGPLAGSVTWDRTAATCATYCHGATLAAGGTNTLPTWTAVGTGQTACGTCHGNPPPAPHPSNPSCTLCHPDTVGEDGTIRITLGKHLDGRLDASGECGACHGLPPPQGAHLAHAVFEVGDPPTYGDLGILESYSPAGGPAYRFGCGHCHPLDPARHLDGVLDVELTPPPGASNALRARNAPGASWDPATGTCSGVYCHSSGQETPAYATTPGWTSGASLGCGGCHGNPPAYRSGGAAAPDANGHIGLTDLGREFGHYLGMGGPSHAHKHGGGAHTRSEGAAPITCQACHFETTDPAGAGPSGFYWLDTTGSYVLPGGDPARHDDPRWQATQCAACHGGAPAPAGSGRVLPLRHVNGRRDVVFDARTALPALATLPAAPDTPTRPYWVTNARFCEGVPPGGIFEGKTLSLHLGGARWDPATKSCSGVACHLGDTPVWGRPYRATPAQGASCCGCHGSVCAR